MQTSNKKATRAWRAHCLTVIALAVGLALCAPALAQRTATATATVVKGFMVAITVTDGGSGYWAAPEVTIVGGGGSGAAAVATVVNGVVTEVRVVSAGSGYASAPDVIIGAPRVAQLTVLELALVPRLTFYGAVGSTNEIQYVNAFGDTNHWLMLTNVVLTDSPQVWYDTISPPGSQRYYQAVVLGTGPLPPTPPGFVWIPPGRFTLGSPASEQDRFDWEGPQTQVTLTHGFFMGRTEVTQAEYQSVMGSNPSGFTGDPNLPVERVTWHEAIAFCMAYTEQERAAGRLPSGWVYRLPTEAEWEYACRAETTTRFSFGDDPNYTRLGSYAWYGSNSGGQTHPVGLKLANPWGLYDMSGNVWEWCLDWHGAYPGGSVTDPPGPATGSHRVSRGGGWDYDGQYCRSAYRDSGDPADRGSGLGFRAVMASASGGGVGEPARITQGPASREVMPGLTASFTVQASGSAPLYYQWYKDGARLTAGARVSGVDTPTLTIANTETGDAGLYTVEVRNDWGLEVSQPATLSFGVPGFVWLPPGTFTMGSPGSEQDRYDNEGPQTVVTLTRGFWMGRYEVTQAEYQAVMGSNPSYFTGDPNRPVDQVTWHEATNYCGRLTELERAAGRLPAGCVYRLPTEAEWEYACRAGTTTRFSYGDDPDYSRLGNHAWYGPNSGRQTHPVGQKLPNPWGLYDMSGNVWEWCLDWYAGSHPGGAVTNPTGPNSGSSRVIRGDGWDGGGRYCRSANRFISDPAYRGTDLGFRAVMAYAPARITQGPASREVLPGLTASFTVQASGAAPLYYQWYKDGQPLADGGRISGATTTNLVISNFQFADAGGYTVEVRNDWGLEVSQPATLSFGVPGFVWLPPGTFTMGSPGSEQDRYDNEGPQTQVTLTRGFWMGRYEVTQAEYTAAMGSNPSYFTGDPNRPVDQVTWHEATNYCGRLTEQERLAGRLPAGYIYRLPTEAEWEYACRAGTMTRFSFGDDPDYSRLGNYAWYGSNSGRQTHPVGQKLPNPWGLYDMSGNVWEWCLDWYAGSHPGGAVTNPTGPNSGSYRVIRGDGWDGGGRYCRSAGRFISDPAYRGTDLGFRVALAPGQ